RPPTSSPFPYTTLFRSDTAFAAMIRAGAEALIVLEDTPLLSGLRGRTVDLAATHRLPAMYAWRQVVAAGGLMSYGPSMPDMERRSEEHTSELQSRGHLV